MSPNGLELRIIQRTEAKALGLKSYSTGRPCKRGHVAERYVSGGNCHDCLRLNDVKRTAPPKVRSAGQAKPENWRLIDRARRNIRQQSVRNAKDPGLAVRRAANEAEKAAMDAARSQGLTAYQSIRACASGHLGMRQVINSTCLTCVSLRRKEIIRARGLILPEIVQYHAAKKARLEAIATDAKTYLGAPCKHGHHAFRSVVGWQCVECRHLRTASIAEKKKVYDAKRQVAQREILTKKSLAWKRANPEKRKATSQNYKHKRRAQEESGMTGRDLAEWRRAALKVCAYCGADCAGKFHVDHVMPLALGGLHEAGNLAIACPPCNHRKSAKHPDVFKEEMASS